MKFKKLLSAVAATAMAASAFAGLAMSGNAASTDTYREWVIINSTDADTAKAPTVNSNGTLTVEPELTIPSGTATKNAKIEAGSFDGYGTSFTIDADTKYYYLAGSSAISSNPITLATNLTSNTDCASYEFKIVYQSKGGDGAALKVNGTETPAASTAGQIVDYTQSDMTAETIEITRKAGEARIMYIGIKYNKTEGGTDEPTDPTEAPADPTEAPADPTEAPADPTAAPELVAVSTETTWTGASFDVVDQSSGTIFAKDATMKIDCNDKQVKTTADNIFLYSGSTIITIHPEADGVITVNASSSNNEKARDIVIGGTTISGGAPGRSNGSADSKVEITGGSDITIKFSGGGGYINSIKYEPGATLAPEATVTYVGESNANEDADAAFAYYATIKTNGKVVNGIKWIINATQEETDETPATSGEATVYYGLILTAPQGTTQPTVNAEAISE